LSVSSIREAHVEKTIPAKAAADRSDYLVHETRRRARHAQCEKTRLFADTKCDPVGERGTTKTLEMLSDYGAVHVIVTSDKDSSLRLRRWVATAGVSKDGNMDNQSTPRGKPGVLAELMGGPMSKPLVLIRIALLVGCWCMWA
jgi:hypothetical protein